MSTNASAAGTEIRVHDEADVTDSGVFFNCGTEKLEIQHQKSALKREEGEKNRSLPAKQDELQAKQEQILERLQTQIAGIKSCILPVFMIEWRVKESIMENSSNSVANSGKTTKTGTVLITQLSPPRIRGEERTKNDTQ